jgi:putative ABC transport system permease protein
MVFQDLVSSAWQSLKRTRNRSFLTMLGIIIGIAAVILALSIGESAQKYILSQISSFGSDQLILDNGPREDTSGGPSPFVEETLQMKDTKRLKKEDWITGVVGQVFQTDLIQAEGTAQNLSVIGTMPDDLVINDYSMDSGYFFSEEDLDGRTRVAVLGNSVAENFFGYGSPVGRSIKIGKTNYRIIGVLEPLGTQFFQNLDEIVYIPVTTLMEQYNKDRFTFITVRSALPIAESKIRLEEILRDSHDIDNPQGDYEKDDFHVVTQEEAIKVVGQVTGILQILLAAIAAISLLVAGIGIMNIMYVSVTERISEIGLRKSIGARYKDVLRQFLAEAVALTLGGGVLGIGVGLLTAWIAIQVILVYQDGWEFIVSWSGAALGVTVSTFIGLVFGYLPARKAAKMHPIEALRTE